MKKSTQIFFKEKAKRQPQTIGEMGDGTFIEIVSSSLRHYEPVAKLKNSFDHRGYSLYDIYTMRERVQNGIKYGTDFREDMKALKALSRVIKQMEENRKKLRKTLDKVN